MDSQTTRHLTDDELVAELDRERPADARLDAHLEACWSCRARYEELQSSVHGFIRLREDILLAVPEPPPMWPGLEAGMDRIDTERGGRSLWARMRRRTPASWSSRVAIAASVILVLWIAGATPAAAPRAIRDAFRFVQSLFIDATPVRPVARSAQPRDIVLPAPVEVRPVTRPTAPPTRVAAPVNLVDLELEALWRLHRVGALVGEQVVIERSPRQLSVEVRVEDAERKTQLREALAPVTASGGRVRIQTFAEAAASNEARPAAAPRVALHDIAAVADRSAASELLTKHFAAQFESEADPRVATAAHDFSTRVLESARQITLHAFALRRISERPGGDIGQASHPAQVTYHVLVREYAAAVESRAAALIRDLQPLLGGSEAATTTESRVDVEALAAVALQLEDEVRGAFAVQTGPDELRTVEGGTLLRLARAVARTAAEIRRSSSR
jgi:hypothetical protein